MDDPFATYFTMHENYFWAATLAGALVAAAVSLQMGVSVESASIGFGCGLAFVILAACYLNGAPWPHHHFFFQGRYIWAIVSVAAGVLGGMAIRKVPSQLVRNGAIFLIMLGTLATLANMAHYSSSLASIR